MKYQVSISTKTWLLFFTCEINRLSSHVKRSPLLWLHNKTHLSQQKNYEIEIVYYFIWYLYDKINRTLWPLGDTKFPNEKFCISVRLCNILYFSNQNVSDSKGIQKIYCVIKINTVHWASEPSQIEGQNIIRFKKENNIIIGKENNALQNNGWRILLKFLLAEHNLFYYIDTSVLLESIPLVKFIKATSGTWVVYFP